MEARVPPEEPQHEATHEDIEAWDRLSAEQQEARQ